MKKLLTACTAAALGGVVMLTSIMPAAAAVPLPGQPASATSDVQTVRKDGRERIIRKQRFDRNRAGFRRGHAVRYHNWRGHRGYRYYRPGYRRYNGWWYPPAAFSVGVVIGTRANRGNAHVRWCRNHYVSYRASDNTFQPYEGPRRQCRSPY